MSPVPAHALLSAVPATAAAGWTASAWGTVLAEYDASVASSVHDTAGAVDQWDDLSGNARHLVQTGSSRPTTGRTSPSGLAVIDFDGTDDSMTANAATTQAQPFTQVCAALNDDGANAQNQTMFAQNTTAAVLSKTVSDVWQINGGAGLPSATAPDTSAHVFVAVYNGASSVLYRDGASIASGNAGSNGYTNAVRLGAQQTGTNRWDGWIGHAILYAGILADPAGLSAALKTRWGTV